MEEIDYKEIKENCPKAYDRVLGYGQDTHNLTERGMFIMPMRSLYDFFDSFGVYVGIQMFKLIGSSEFVYLIGRHREDVVSISFDTRIEAEKAAFTEAFKILEQKLKDKE